MLRSLVAQLLILGGLVMCLFGFLYLDWWFCCVLVLLDTVGVSR